LYILDFVLFSQSSRILSSVLSFLSIDLSILSCLGSVVVALSIILLALTQSSVKGRLLLLLQRSTHFWSSRLPPTLFSGERELSGPFAQP
jgi:hypothetical protein